MSIIKNSIVLLIMFIYCSDSFGQNTEIKVLYQDEFNTENDLNWPIGENQTRVFRMYGSKYIFEHISDDKAALVTREIPTYIPKTYECSARIKIVKTTGAGIGIIFGSSNASNFHAFTVSSNGYFRYGYYENGNYKEPIPWKEITALKPETFNILKYKIDGTQVEFFINDISVGSTPYRGNFGAKIGFIVYDKQNIEIDNLILTHEVEKQDTRVVKLPTNQSQINSTTNDESINEAKSEDGDDYKFKYALVVGNSKYSEVPLKNPVNDAVAISKELSQLGFTVIEVTDATRKNFRNAIREFSDAIADNPGVGLFYYAGHGLQSNGINYLVPIDANIQNEYEIEDECIRADLVLRMLASLQNPMNVVILDACRNNPFASAYRSVNRGLAQPQAAPTGSIIAFATAPGKTASDGEGNNGLYTQELIKAMQKPGLTLESIFKEVRINVSKLSDGDQIPWENSSLMGDFYFRTK